MQEKKYNLLFISSFASLKGGGQRSLLLLLKYLNKDKFLPIVIVPEEGEFSQSLLKPGIKSIILDFHKVRSFNIFAVLNCLSKLYKIVKKENIHLIHTDSPRQTFYAGLVAKFLRLPVIIHLRVTDTNLFIDKVIYRLCDRLIAVSEAAAKRFRFFDKQKKLKVVYNSVELDKYTPTQTKVEDDLLRLGYFGRIHRRKGIEVIINAIKNLDKVELLVMGDGDEDYLRELKEIASGLDVTFKPYQPNVISEIGNVDVVVLPSFYGEGLSRILIEAQAMGKIAIASDSPSNPEVLGEEFREFIFPTGDVEKLRERIKHILENREILLSKGRLARQRAENLFDVRNNTRAIEKLYLHFLQS